MPFLKTFKTPRSRILEELTKKNGLRHLVVTVKGDRYKGEWKNNMKQGKGAQLTRRQLLYEGDWFNGMKHGYGVLSKVLEDGTFILLYEGDWLFGKPEGFGRKHFPVDGYYDGEVKAGNRHGHGRMWFADGSFYEGNWIDDLKDGLGLFVATNGNRYEGHWRVGKKHGYGEFFHLDSGQMQAGLWNQGVAVCTTLTDILFRQACEQPTPYPILQIGLRDSDQVYKSEYDRVAAEQEEPKQEEVEDVYTPHSSSRPTLSPWFYIDCCNKDFSRVSR